MTQSHLVTTADERGLRPTLEELLQNTRLLIRFRWVAGLSILLGTGFAQMVLNIHLKTVPLLLIGAVVLSYNVLLFLACRDDDETVEWVQRIALAQIILDWLAMIALVHFTGGITSPALIYFVIHAALSGMVLLPWEARSLSLLVIIIVGSLALLERVDWLPHVALTEFELGENLYKNTTYISAVMSFFGTTVIVLSELVTYRTQQLRQREAQIRQLYEARSTFIRVATHELRSPLGAALSLMRNIEQGYAGNFTEQQAAILHRVSSRMDGLRKLIDDLLTLASSQEATAAHVPLEPASVRDTLQKIIERERPNVDARQIKLHLNLADDSGIVMAGDVGLAIIFGNLLNNAIKYTPESGDVTVEFGVSRLMHTVEIVITDTGIGIPADDLPNIFNEFFRAKNAKSAQINGTGIGLSTVRTLVERYHGTITLQSEQDKGTTVRVMFPLALDRPQPKAVDKI
jgi:signal transduction histidine kinase